MTVATAGGRGLVVVGGGPRMLGLLTANPGLLDHVAAVVTSSSEIGSGRLGTYRIRSNSASRDFLAWIDAGGRFGPVLADPSVRRFREAPGNGDLAEAGHVLARAGWYLGNELRNELGEARVTLDTEVERVEIRRSGREQVVLCHARRGVVAEGRHVVLATGIVEEPADELRDVRCASSLSGAVIRDDGQRDRLRGLLAAGGRVCIVGGSHSAASCVLRLLDGGRVPGHGTLTVLHRGDFRFFYADLERFHAGSPAVQGEDRALPGRLCPVTGAVNRYSGLRFEAAETIRRGLAGGVPGLTFRKGAPQDVPTGTDAVIQALGYRSQKPEIADDDGPVRPRQSRGVVDLDPHFRLLAADGRPLPIFAAGLRPNPTADAGAGGTGLHGATGLAIERILKGSPARLDYRRRA